jgi:hypothetical protein
MPLPLLGFAGLLSLWSSNKERPALPIMDFTLLSDSIVIFNPLRAVSIIGTVAAGAMLLLGIWWGLFAAIFKNG